jgi:hypothetical protein
MYGRNGGGKAACGRGIGNRASLLRESQNWKKERMIWYSRHQLRGWERQKKVDVPVNEGIRRGETDY